MLDSDLQFLRQSGLLHALQKVRLYLSEQELDYHPLPRANEYCSLGPSVSSACELPWLAFGSYTMADRCRHRRPSAHSRHVACGTHHPSHAFARYFGQRCYSIPTHGAVDATRAQLGGRRAMRSRSRSRCGLISLDLGSDLATHAGHDVLPRAPSASQGRARRHKVPYGRSRTSTKSFLVHHAERALGRLRLSARGGLNF